VTPHAQTVPFQPYGYISSTYHIKSLTTDWRALGAKLVIILGEIFNRAYVALSVLWQQCIGLVGKLAHWQQQHCQRKEPRLTAKVLCAKCKSAKSADGKFWAVIVCRPLKWVYCS